VCECVERKPCSIGCSYEFKEKEQRVPTYVLAAAAADDDDDE
jgi:hypothetical protein